MACGARGNNGRMESINKMRVFDKERMKMQKRLARVLKAYVDELPSFVTPSFSVFDDEVVITLKFEKEGLENYNIEDYEVRRKRV